MTDEELWQLVVAAQVVADAAKQRYQIACYDPPPPGALSLADLRVLQMDAEANVTRLSNQWHKQTSRR